MASFRKRGTTWEYRISYQDDEGHNRIKSGSGYRTKTEASEAADLAKIDLKNPTLKNKDVLLSHFFKEWAETYKRPHISEVTWQKYEQTMRHIDIFLPNQRISGMTLTKYQKVLNDFGSQFAQETLENFHFHIKSAMKVAVREHIVDDNFTEGAVAKSQVPKRPVSEKFLEADEYKTLIDKTQAHFEYITYFAIYLIANTGLRYAEADGLTWDDVDFENKLIDINKTWNYSVTRNFAPTKNQSSIRQVPVSDQVTTALKEYKKTYWKKNEYNRIIFGVSNSAVNKILKGLVGRKVHVHSLRHTYASYLISKGVDLITISRILGHENLNITLKVYAHQLDELKEKNFAVIREIFDTL